MSSPKAAGVAGLPVDPGELAIEAVPVTSRLDNSPAVLPPAFADVIARIVPVAPSLKTH